MCADTPPTGFWGLASGTLGDNDTVLVSKYGKLAHSILKNICVAALGLSCDTQAQLHVGS